MNHSLRERLWARAKAARAGTLAFRSKIPMTSDWNNRLTFVAGWQAYRDAKLDAVYSGALLYLFPSNANAENCNFETAVRFGRIGCFCRYANVKLHYRRRKGTSSHRTAIGRIFDGSDSPRR